jgi:predicted short-subunit dehydrogenase-like oxidoreductase (DUF2520 family)
MAGHLTIVGAGRAGLAFAGALGDRGWTVRLLRRGDDVAGAAEGTDVVLLCVPDRDVAPVAQAISPGPAVVAHVAGSLTLDVLAPHEPRASVHPLVSLPPAPLGAARLSAGGWFAVAGHPVGAEIARALGGRVIEVRDEDRPVYHAAACVAANHLVVLLGQVERLAASIDVPLAAYLDLARGAVDNVAALGALAALTGPAARGDDATLAAHRAALPEAELGVYDCLASAARRLADGTGHHDR